MYGWKFYEVETYDNEKDKTIKIEGFEELEQAEQYIKRTIKNKLLDYNEKMILFKRIYNLDRELIEEEFLRIYDYNYNEELENFILGDDKK